MKMIANYIIIEINIKAESKGKVRVSSHSDKRGERAKNAYYLLLVVQPRFANLTVRYVFYSFWIVLQKFDVDKK